jgi:hypothetical protein
VIGNVRLVVAGPGAAHLLFARSLLGRHETKRR